MTLSVTDRDAVGRTLRPEPGKTISRRRIVGVVVGATVGLDQVTKLVALRRLSPTAIHIWGDLVRLQLSDNAGAFLGLGAKLSPSLRFWVFTVASAAMVLWVLAYALRTDDLPRDGIVAMALVAGGGIGNLIDRTSRGGKVVDFLNFGLGHLRTGILNIADIAIFFGALYVMWVAVQASRRSVDSDD